MLKVYFKQAWQLIRQNKLYSTVYITGTGLAIAMTMVIALIYYIKIAPVYPETNRNRTLVADYLSIQYLKKDMYSSSSLSYQFVQEHMYTLETPQAVTAIYNTWGEDFSSVEVRHNNAMLPVLVKYVDHNFWKVFEFNYLNGKPFTETDFRSGIKTAVISATLANTLFGTVEAEGYRMKLDGNEFRISGVVRDVSLVTPVTCAHIWVPFTIHPEKVKPDSWAEGLLGIYEVYMLAPSAQAVDAVRNEVDQLARKINSGQEEYTLSMQGRPEVYWKSVFRSINSHLDWYEIFKTLGVLLLALLIIPAINLAGMISSQMEKRLSETGIRKAFGASRRKLLMQILVENFLLTLWGGIVGLLVSYGIVYFSKNWILNLFDQWTSVPYENMATFFTVDMMFNPVIFLLTLIVCFILNFLSAIIPARHSLKKTITYSLNHNK